MGFTVNGVKVSLVGKLKPKKILHALTAICDKIFSAPPLLRRVHPPWPHEELAFMVVNTIVVKVNPRRRGWQRSVNSILRMCQGARFKMDGEGLVEVSGVTNPMRVLRRVGISRTMTLQWFQYGQCCKYLNMLKSDPPKSSSLPPPPPPPSDLYPLQLDDFTYRPHLRHHNNQNPYLLY
ncbi:hypothetical protein M569_09710 [Genlisea aurea]|uniref:Uncharacterized protein n=1 Tax=Genlisea aurea TaxID=192259 RepID=S8CDM5_9LAMI|nr:hypothetical protein M569_09710 [Genlisea aurea]